MKLQDYQKEALLEEAKEYGLSVYIDLWSNKINNYKYQSRMYYDVLSRVDFLKNELVKERDNKLKIILK